MVAMGIGAAEVTIKISIMRPYTMIKMQMLSAQAMMPISEDWNHRPNSGPISISMSRASMSPISALTSMAVSAMITPAA